MPKEKVKQTALEYISSFHGRNGFSLDRMGKEQAEAFDSELMKILNQNGFAHLVEGEVLFKVIVADISVP